MIRKFFIAAVAAGATLGLFAESPQADARPRVRVYVGPGGASVRWRGNYRPDYRPYRSSYLPYNRGFTFSYGQPYYGQPYYGGAYYGGYTTPFYSNQFQYTYPQYGGGVYYGR